jgi:large subunit ribosomal protein L25
MQEVVLNVDRRTLIGKKAKQLLREKKIPGVFYVGNENVAVQADEASIRNLSRSHVTRVIRVRFNDGTEQRAILHDLQIDPVFDRIIHFDLHGVREGQKITVQVPLQLLGTPKGVKDGGVVQHSLHRIKIQCSPENVPEHITVDITELGIADSLHVKDLKVDGVRILDNPESAIVTIVPPPSLKEETAEAAVAAEQPAEPEVISKAKKAEETESEQEGKGKSE